jgi:hypothetical protein
MEISSVSLPCPATSIFDRVLTIDWYDGITSGAVRRTLDAAAFRFDLITWGPGQDRRVFALSPITISAFESVIDLWSQLEQPKWPVWHVPWRLMSEDLPRWNRELDAILAGAAKPSFALEADALFETIFGIRSISDQAPELPSQFDGRSFLDNYQDWHRYLGESV